MISSMDASQECKRLQDAVRSLRTSVDSCTRLLQVIDEEDFEGEGNAVAKLNVHDPARDFRSEQIGVMRLAFDDDPERDESVDLLRFRERGTDEWNLKRTGSLAFDDLRRRNPRTEEHGAGGPSHPLDLLLIIGRPHDADAP